jgi:hypothetical protein
MPSHLKNILDAKLGKAMGKSANIPRVLEPIQTHIGSLGRRRGPHAHTTTHTLSIAQAGPGTTFGAMVVCQCLELHPH